MQQTNEQIAKRLGLPVETVRSGLWFMEWKAAKKRREDNKYLSRREEALANRVDKILLHQRDYVIARLARFESFKSRNFTKKSLFSDVQGLFEDFPDKKKLAALLASYAGLTMLRGARNQKKEFKDDGITLGISFDLKNKRAIDYLSNLESLHLSDRNGSIFQHTKERIIEIISGGVDEGVSYTEIAKRIREQTDSGIFSRARAELIATHEIGDAYEYGKDAYVKEHTERYGLEYLKHWQTVNDDKVTAACAANEAAGWIPMDAAFPSGDMRATRKSNPRCRCNTRYREASLVRGEA